jgi:hypothetical protein
MRAGDQHHPAGERAAWVRVGGLRAGLPGRGGAHAFCVSANCTSFSMRASSPDSNSSSVMSQPPISSPLMKSCGKVGQLE